MDAPVRQPCPQRGRGRMRFICFTGIPYSGNSTPSQLGCHSGGEKPLERQRLSPFSRNTFLILILDLYSNYIFTRYFLYRSVVKMALYPLFLFLFSPAGMNGSGKHARYGFLKIPTPIYRPSALFILDETSLPPGNDRARCWAHL